MGEPFPFVHMNYDQLSQLIAQMLVYRTYLQRKVAPSAKRNRTLRALQHLVQRLSSLFGQGMVSLALMLTVEDVTLIKEALIILQRALEAKALSEGRMLEIQRLEAMRTLIEQTFSLPQKEE